MARTTRMLLLATIALTVAALVAPTPALAAPLDSSAPTSTVKLIFVHHSTGEAWLANGLGVGLRDANYFVSDTNYGWGPDAIGDHTDVGDWWTWFRGSNAATYTTALYGEYGQHAGYSRLATDPGGANQVVMFKSCFPNSSIGGSASDTVPPIGSNPLKGAGMSNLTVGNAKGVYLDFLEYARLHPEKLFVLIVSPPLRPADTNPTHAANARYLANWLVDPSGWLAGYPLHNVVAFDYYTVLTGGHHRVVAGAIDHTAGPTNYLAYPTGDSHPSAEGHTLAAADFVPLLNAAYHVWRSDAAPSPAPVTTHTVVPASPGGWSGWYVATPTVTVTRDIAGLTYFKPASAPDYASTSVSPLTLVPPQGETTYSYFGVSSLGVTETPVRSFTLKLDTQAPSATDDAVATYTDSASIHLTAIDPAPGAGVVDLFWSLDGLPSSGVTVTTSIVGHHTLEYRPYDKAGNYGELTTVSFEVTSTPTPAPVTSHALVPPTPGGTDGWYVATPTVTISRSIAGLTYHKPASAPDYASTSSSPLTLVPPQGDTTYSYFGVSSLGVTETPPHSFAVKLDTRPPSTTDDAVASYVGTANITLSAIDPTPGSGVSVTYWSLDSIPGTGPTVTTSVSGSHVLTYISLDNAGNSETLKSVFFEVTGGVSPSAETSRMAGADRYEVARNLAIETFPGFAGTRHVIIACGSDRAIADPLSAAGLAGVYDAPVLLVQNDRRVVVPSATMSTLAAMKSANGPLYIHVVGGPASVTPAHLAVLRTFGTIDRIGGADRYAVAAGVAARMRSVLGVDIYPKTALVANGNMPAYFYNALAASPVAAKGHFPILLVKNGSVPPATASALGSYTTRYVIGDSNAVNAAAYALAGGTLRLGGADRYAVAVSVADHFTASGLLSWGHVGVAAKLPDALTGGASVGLLGGPILFTDPLSLPVVTGDALAAHKAEIETLYLLGGTASVTPAVEAQIRSRLGL